MCFCHVLWHWKTPASVCGCLDSSSGCWVSLVAQTIKNLPAMQETQVPSLGQEDPLEKGHVYPPQYSCLENPMDRGAWRGTVHGVAKSQIQLRRVRHDWTMNTFTFIGCKRWQVLKELPWQKGIGICWISLLGPCVLYDSESVRFSEIRRGAPLRAGSAMSLWGEGLGQGCKWRGLGDRLSNEWGSCLADKLSVACASRSPVLANQWLICLNKIVGGFLSLSLPSFLSFQFYLKKKYFGCNAWHVGP